MHALFKLLVRCVVWCAPCAVLLEKFKDKASVVNKAATEALQAMARYCFALADVAEDIAAALAHQNPKVKEGTLSWLTTCITRETKQGVTKLMPMVVPAAAKRTDEGAPSIREAAFGFLVQAALKVRRGAGARCRPSSAQQRTSGNNNS